MSILGAIKEVFRSWNNWREDKAGRLRREIKALQEKKKRLQKQPPTKKRVRQLQKIIVQIKKKKDYLIQGAK